MQYSLRRMKGRSHLGAGGEVLLEGRLDSIGILASAGS
jgi:hypothetical protein